MHWKEWMVVIFMNLKERESFTMSRMPVLQVWHFDNADGKLTPVVLGSEGNNSKSKRAHQDRTRKRRRQWHIHLSLVRTYDVTLLIKTYILISFLPANSIFRQRWHNRSFVLNGPKSDVLIYWCASLSFTREIKNLIVAVSRRLYIGHSELTRDWKGSINRDNGLSMIHASMTRLLKDVSSYRPLKLTVYLTGYRKAPFAGCPSVCGIRVYCIKWRTNAEPMATLMLSVNWSLTETFTAVMHSMLKLSIINGKTFCGVPFTCNWADHRKEDQAKPWFSDFHGDTIQRTN